MFILLLRGQRFIVSRSMDRLEGRLQSDGELAEHEMTREVAELINQTSPWGQDFPEPVFDGEFTIVRSRIVGDNHIKMVVKTQGSHRGVDAIAFNAEAHGWREGLSRIHMAYKLGVNEYQGFRNPQLVVRYLQRPESSKG